MTALTSKTHRRCQVAQASIPEFPINSKQFNIGDVPFEVVVYTSKCVTLTSLKTGKSVQFSSHGALNIFVEQLRWYLAHRQAMEAEAA